MISVLEISNSQDIKQIMQDIKVDNYGIKIMLPKAITHLIRINSVSCITANILKQEMLSLGGDVAVARDALTGRIKRTDCLAMGNLSQFNRLNKKLKKQPFGLNEISRNLEQTLGNYQKDRFCLDLGKFKLRFRTGKTYIMGVVNLTPDSFSQDGLYGQNLNYIVDYAEQMVKDGADIIDLGGESSRPGAKPVSLKEELSRTIPVIKILAKKIKVPISIDTYKPQVARQALDNGANIVNDITGLKNPKMAKLIAKYRAGVIIMHMQCEPATMQNKPVYKNLITEIIGSLDKAINQAVSNGIEKEKIIIDPGLGFGKTKEHNLEILNNLHEFKVLGRPLLVGPSRKSFLSKILNLGPGMRIFGTVSACVLAAKNGANIVRVHDVKEVKQALKVSEAINNI